MRVSFIATVLNEEKTIGRFLKSLFRQSRMPDEIIIVDGGSSDSTIAKIRNPKSEIRNKRIKVKIIVKKGNRAVGRNEAIKHATGDVIVCSDSGCILDKDWIKNIIEPFSESKIDVVAGYYKGKASSIFQKCLIPYVLVMPDKINEQDFLPASRSMAFRKSVWEEIGGFPEQFSHNEDYAFAKELKEINTGIVFKKDAIVYWIPRENFKEAFVMFFRFALGDTESGIIRPKVVLIFVRYLTGSILVISFFVLRSPLILNALFIILAFYIAWSILKNFKYVNYWNAIIYLPLLQLTADIAVLLGTGWGILIRLRTIY